LWNASESRVEALEATLKAQIHNQYFQIKKTYLLMNCFKSTR
jgi:hypothetical protein